MNRKIKLLAVLLLLPGSGCTAEKETVPEVTPSSETAAPAETAKPAETEDPAESVYRRGMEMTVCIFTPGGNNGAGFVYGGSYVVTNDHVLYDTDVFTIRDAEGEEYTGEIVFSDPGDDIAVIKVEGMRRDSVTFGDSDALAAVDELLCRGNPAEGEPFSYCMGKLLEQSDQMKETLKGIDAYLASDADIVSGYSGGPVFSLAGELVGISNARYQGDMSAFGVDQLSLLIPINRVREKIEEAVQP